MFDSHISSTSLPPPTLAPGQLPPFMGYYRADGRVGTRNYWLVLPLFPGETQQLALLKEALMTTLGYQGANPYVYQLRALREQYRAGSYFEAPQPDYTRRAALPLFANIDGVRFLPYLYEQEQSPDRLASFWQLLAGYCTHPNVGGITVLSMDGADSSPAVDMIRQYIVRSDPAFGKSFVVANRLAHANEFDWLSAAARQTFHAMADLNQQTRRPAPLSSLTVGVRWGEASGLSANPAVGYCVQTALKLGATVLTVIPDSRPNTTEKAAHPCPIARTESAPGLQPYCFPGNTVEVTTALVGAGCTLHLSTNGSGQPTGNPVAPVVELAVRQTLPDGMADWIDIDCGGTDKDTTIARMGETILQYSLKLASGEQRTQSETRGQYDFRVYQP